MNIFVLDENPMLAAKYQCNKHVVKMPLETAQLLCTPYNEAPYKKTHFNHPCAKWTRLSKDNYMWLVAHGLALSDEYENRYNREHKSREVIKWCAENINELSFEKNYQTPFELCMPKDYTFNTTIKSYRNFYILDKHFFSVWPKHQPYWWKNIKNENITYTCCKCGETGDISKYKNSECPVCKKTLIAKPSKVLD